DQRVLLGELAERGVQPAGLRGPPGNDHRLQRGRGEVSAGRAAWPADPVADSNAGHAPQPGDLASADSRAGHGATAAEDAEPGALALAAGAQPEPIPDAQGAGEHPDVGDLLPGWTSFHLEHGAADRSGRVALGCRKQLADGVGQSAGPG